MKERLQKIIANAGITSRRKAEVLITDGMVTVNGEVTKTLGAKADPSTDHIKVNGKLINPKLDKKSDTYIVLNKPKGYLSAVSDPEERKTVVELVRGFGRLFPVGRLDFNSEGLILLTNDGDFANRVASARKVPKVYQVKVQGKPTENAIERLKRGIRLLDGYRTAPAEIRNMPGTAKNSWFEVTLLEGHNRQIRKMFDAVGNTVVKLRRVRIGNIKDVGLQVGEYRELTPREVKFLQR